jgi:CheY-like chemotaxis protein
MATERPAKAKRILVVEDEPMIRMLLEDMLSELGYTVAAEAAGTGYGEVPEPYRGRPMLTNPFQMDGLKQMLQSVFG